MHESGSGLLISAVKGLFLAREQDGKATISQAGEAAIGPALSGGILQLAGGGTLIGADKGLFLAREASGKVTVARVPGDGDLGRVLAVRAVPSGALIGTEKGLFAGRAGTDNALTLARVEGISEAVQVLHELPGAG